MKVNAFFVHGFVSTISASVIAKTIHDGDVNVLFVERMENMFTNNYYAVNRLFEEYYKWAKMVHISRDELMDLNKRRPLQYIKGIGYYKSFGPTVRGALSEFDAVDNIYACMPSRCWSFASTGKTMVNILEHGMSEYNLLESVLKPSGGIRFCKRMLSKMFGYKVICGDELLPDGFVFTDGNRAGVVNKYADNKRLKLRSIDSRDVIRDMFESIQREYSKRYPEEYGELIDIKRKMSAHSNRYIYLPTLQVPFSAYDDYLDEQVKSVPMEDACVLIKTHYYRSDDIADCFKRHQCELLRLEKPFNKLLPVELLGYILGFPVIWSNFSSALLYYNWWLNARSVLAEVRNSKDNDFLVNEYISQVDDFRSLNVQGVCSEPFTNTAPNIDN